eukprot:TRINITY_DN15130_c0_g1_i1.p1 TRINITY_DN15130_c0_g1~~TRINITY_DN15130_c0_g1_i1.p1  ORF type:complete len:157 (-),score=31.94 TRINITY_DN15130_c0_g1_i1:23-493(-)
MHISLRLALCALIALLLLGIVTADSANAPQVIPNPDGDGSDAVDSMSIVQIKTALRKRGFDCPDCRARQQYVDRLKYVWSLAEEEAVAAAQEVGSKDIVDELSTKLKEQLNTAQSEDEKRQAEQDISQLVKQLKRQGMTFKIAGGASKSHQSHDEL